MIALDPSNPVVQSIGRGMQSEMAGDRAAARTAYETAWNAAQDDFERCIAAHYVPRILDDPKEVLRWNEDALRLALAVGDDRVRGFMASLNACVGQARLVLGDLAGAREALETAARCLPDVPEGGYKAGLVGMIDKYTAQVRESAT